MYRSSSDYRFSVRPGRRRGSINDLIEKYNVLSESRPSQSANNIFYYNDYYNSNNSSNYHRKADLSYKMYRHQAQKQSQTSHDDATDYVDEYYQDEFVSASSAQAIEDPKTVLSKLARMALPIWLMIKPVLETVTVAPLPLFFSVTGTGIFALLVIFILPRTFSELLLYPGFRLVFGTLYPAYASYKAVRTKNVKEYVSIFFCVLMNEINLY